MFDPARDRGLAVRFDAQGCLASYLLMPMDGKRSWIHMDRVYLQREDDLIECWGLP